MLQRSARHLVLVAALAATTLVPAATSQAQVAPMPAQIARGGFGDAQNTYSWSMAWFKNKLYVGTARNARCVEAATADFHLPGRGHYQIHPEPEITCPADRYDLNLQAEIWQFTPETGAWTRVFQSPNDVPNPRAPGKFVARDIGFRGMVVHRDLKGEEALYVGGVTADEYIPELASTNPPRILRTTDGTSFTPVAGRPPILATAYGPLPAIGYRAMVSHNGRLIVTASNSLTGDGVVVEVEDPSGPSPTFTQISPSTLQVFELQVFNGFLYVGAGDSKTNTGYSVWKTDANRVPGGALPNYSPVITGGAGRGQDITSVVAMQVFKGRLYVGSSGWYNTFFPASELVRVNPDDTWDLVVGNARATPQGRKSPISGQGDGFGNIFNAHFWRAVEFSGALYVGTNDWSWAFRNFPYLDPHLRRGYGFDIHASCDGQYWFAVTTNAFGDGLYNFGARTMASTPTGGYVGSANHVQGTAVWRATNTPACGPAVRTATPSPSAAAESLPPIDQPAPTTAAAAPTTSARATGQGGVDASIADQAPADQGVVDHGEAGHGVAAQAPADQGVAAHGLAAQALTAQALGGPSGLASPGRLLADTQACGTALSWDPAAGAVGYKVLRSEYIPVPVSVEPPPPYSAAGATPRAADPASPTAMRGSVLVPDAPVVIGASRAATFVDRSARPGTRYAYQVVAEWAGGTASPPSNVAFAPSERPATTFADTAAAVGDTDRRGRLAAGASGRLQRLLAEAQERAARSNRAGALRLLEQLEARARGSEVTDALAREDLGDVAFRLRRQVAVAGAACSPGGG